MSAVQLLFICIGGKRAVAGAIDLAGVYAARDAAVADLAVM